jgi:peptide deformylase
VEYWVSLLTILEFPDRRLRTIAAEVSIVDAGIQTLVADMLETMYAAKGIGLAATQVNVHKRVIVMDVSENKDNPLCLINPVIVEQLGTEKSEEGCLSVPGFFETVCRAEQITVKALNRDGESFELHAQGLLAVCIQHEMDHLLGKLFVDYLSAFKRNRIKAKLEKIHRSQEA